MRDDQPLPFSAKLLALPQPLDPLATFPRSDEGNAQAFIHRHGENVRYDYTTEKWLVWNGVYWKPDTGATIGLMSIDTTRARRTALAQIDTTATEREKIMRYALSSENVAKQRALLEASQKHVATTALDWDQDHWLIATTNGTLDLSTQTFRESRREDHITKHLGCAYDEAATCPLWDTFIAQVFQDDQELIDYMQRLCGYLLTGDTTEQKFWMFTGPGGTGKGTLIETITQMLGTYATSVPFDTFEKDRKSSIPSDIMKLKGMRAVFTQEVDEDKKMATGRIKNVTGQDLISARPLYGEWVDFYPEFKIVMAVNHQPDILDDTNAMWRRLRAVPFSVMFEQKANGFLREQLKGELSGILNWCLVGLGTWQTTREVNRIAQVNTTGFEPCSKVETTGKEYRSSQDLVQQWLDDEEFVTHEADKWVSTADCFQSFMAWQKRHGHELYCKSTTISRRLKAKGFQAEIGEDTLTYRRLNGYRGLVVRT